MKHIQLALVIALSFSLFSCGKILEKIKEQKNSTEEMADFTDDDRDSFGRTEDEALFALKNESFGPLQLGLPTAWLEGSVEGLYNGYSVETNEMTGDKIYTLHTEIPTDGSTRNGIDVIQAIGNEDDEIQGYLVPTKYMVYVVVNDHVYELPKLTASDIFKSGECRAFHIYWMGICIYADNMTFFFDPDALTESGSEKVNRDIYEEVTLTRKDFKPNAKPFTVLLGSMTFV